MKYEALTITSPGISKGILMPVVVRQAKALCQRFALRSDFVDVYAVLDTGASISKALAVKLGLKVMSRSVMNTASGLHEVNQYLIDLSMRNNVSFVNIHAAEFTGETKDLIYL